MNFGEPLQNFEQSIVKIKLWWSETPVSTAVELKRGLSVSLEVINI